jgi:sterol desaturase/sphingolipid hydroxylase (fatty acid hydroxylase superfamily)
MNMWQNIILFAIIMAYAAAELASGLYKEFRATSDDTRLELFMFVSLIALVQPLVFGLTTLAGGHFFPQYRNGLAALPWWAMFGILLLVDDLTQYWWHRVSHSPMLWPLHRAHHTAHYMSIRITYRNNFFYYLMMPGIWLSGIFIFLGFANVYMVYVVLKLTVIMGAHCAVRWDEPLYRIRALRPVMWVVERTISTPATHWAHHAMTNQDGVGHYKGNFGNLLFFWDVLFGTAHITRRYPPRVGLKDDELFGKERWFTEMFYPLLWSRREHSALTPTGRAYADEQTQATPPVPGSEVLPT